MGDGSEDESAEGRDVLNYDDLVDTHERPIDFADDVPEWDTDYEVTLDTIRQRKLARIKSNPKRCALCSVNLETQHTRWMCFRCNVLSTRKTVF
ncbi:hypothetical protein JTB14_033295 [Gonioctena quinquepunctata]|nr:hypothetical protein JTB14_033295 [Gonioctena quinquepunctata]